MRVRPLHLSLLLTGSIALLLAAYLGASAYSCSAFLADGAGQCLALAGLDLARSSVAQAGAAACAMLIIFSIVGRRRN